MAQGEFKHITVTPAEEDDVVINAGVARPSEALSPSFDEGLEVAENFNDELEEEAASLPESQAEFVKVAAEMPATRKAQSKRAPKEDDYHEATLEDLKGEPMSLTQKVVIIAAVVCIIGAFAYYFLFLR